MPTNLYLSTNIGRNALVVVYNLRFGGLTTDVLQLAGAGKVSMTISVSMLRALRLFTFVVTAI
jgi:hypothetical protein